MSTSTPTSETTKSFGRGVKLRRKELLMTQVELQNRVYGYRGPAISSLESDWAKQKISLDRAHQIARVLETTVDELVKAGQK